jgi:hypothetical protein
MPQESMMPAFAGAATVKKAADKAAAKMGAKNFRMVLLLVMTISRRSSHHDDIVVGWPRRRQRHMPFALDVQAASAMQT